MQVRDFPAVKDAVYCGSWRDTAYVDKLDVVSLFPGGTDPGNGTHIVERLTERSRSLLAAFDSRNTRFISARRSSGK